MSSGSEIAFEIDPCKCTRHKPYQPNERPDAERKHDVRCSSVPWFAIPNGKFTNA